MYKEEDEDMLSQSIKEKKNHNFGEEEDGMALSHSEEHVRELNSTSLDSKESQQRDEKQSKDVEQRNVLKDNEEGVIKGNRQLEKKIESIHEKECPIQCDFVETINNIISVVEQRRRHSHVLCTIEEMYGEGGKRFETLVEEGDEDQHEELIGETSVEAIEPYVLKIDNW